MGGSGVARRLARLGRDSQLLVFAERVAKQLTGIGVSGSAIFGADKVASPGPITSSVPPEWLRLLEQAEIGTERGLVIPTPAETPVFGGFELDLESPLIMAALGLSVGWLRVAT